MGGTVLRGVERASDRHERPSEAASAFIASLHEVEGLHTEPVLLEPNGFAVRSASSFDCCPKSAKKSPGLVSVHFFLAGGATIGFALLTACCTGAGACFLGGDVDGIDGDGIGLHTGLRTFDLPLSLDCAELVEDITDNVESVLLATDTGECAAEGGNESAR